MATTYSLELMSSVSFSLWHVCYVHINDFSFAGHFLFTELLMPALLAGVQTSPDHHARIITTSSSAAMFDTIHWESLKDGPARRKLSTSTLYSQSKFVRPIAFAPQCPPL